MPSDANIRKGRFCYDYLYADLAFITKVRGVLGPNILKETYRHFERICKNSEVKIIDFDGGDGHVRLRIKYPPKVQLTKLVNSLKMASSRQLKKKYNIEKRSVNGKFWSGSYIAVAVDPAAYETDMVTIDQFIEIYK